MRNTIFSWFVILTLSGCAVVAPSLEWPEGAYPRAYFEAAFQEDELARMYQTEDDYLLWIVRFYNGYTVAQGWLEMTEQVLARLEQGDRAEVEQRLYHLGGRIGSEWAKDSEVRVLNTRNVATWGDALLESLRLDDLDNYLTRVESDVESLYSGELEKEDIYFERYYENEFDF